MPRSRKVRAAIAKRPRRRVPTVSDIDLIVVPTPEFTVQPVDQDMVNPIVTTEPQDVNMEIPLSPHALAQSWMPNCSLLLMVGRTSRFGCDR